MQFYILTWVLMFFCQMTSYASGNLTATCVACHGEKGVSTNPLWPDLAGQHAAYLVKQLNDYQTGNTRQAPLMTGIVTGLTPKDIQAIADFYAALPTPSGVTPKAYLERGESLYRGGDFSKHITACIACHGPDGRGNAEAGFPSLSGQHAAYTLTQLQAFKDKTRTNDFNHIMQDIAQRMDKADMEAVAHYIEGVYKQ
jgi:cytochrome c553